MFKLLVMGDRRRVISCEVVWRKNEKMLLFLKNILQLNEEKVQWNERHMRRFGGFL